MKAIKKVLSSNIIYIVLIILICLIHAINATYKVDFFPINGTFQNYNVVRRVMDGQVPYRDFNIYLGMGHLYLGTLFTMIFGGNFSASLVAFSFLTILAFCTFSIIIGKAINGKKSKVPYLVTLIILIIIITQPLIYRFSLGIFEKVMDALNSSLTPGTSARFIRGMAPVFIILFSSFMFFITRKIAQNQSFTKDVKQWGKLAVLSIGAGLTFMWGNDYGIACFICSIIMIFFITYASTKNLKKTIIAGLAHIVISIITIFLAVLILTRGNISSWLSSMFGTGGAQTWYYGNSIELKSYYIFDIDVSFITVLIALICIYYLIKLYKNNASLDACKTYGILAYITMTSFAAINEYKLLSCGEAVEVGYTILFFVIIYELIRKVLELVGDKKQELLNSIKTIAIMCGAAVLITNTKDCIISFNFNDRGTYVKELGGYLNSLNNDIELAMNFIGDEKIFSTYASALETVTNQYQPSGTDYIIHVLGDNEREDYLKKFEAKDFKYVTTINETYTEFEYWIKNANWFFYRELYKEYIPVFFNEYQTFWEESKENVNIENTNIDTEIIVQDEKNVTIRVKTDTNINGIADVKIKYNAKRDGSLSSKLILNKMIFLTNVQEIGLHPIDIYSNWFLRGEGEEYIPITIINGEGEVTITSLPERDTILSLEKAECESIYTTYFDYLPIPATAYVDDNNKVNVVVDNNQRNIYILENVRSIDIGDTDIKIVNTEENDDGIRITLDYNNADEINKLLMKKNVCKVNK